MLSPPKGATFDNDSIPLVYFPDFYKKYRDFKTHPPSESQARELDKKNWITPELREEINSCFPSANDIDKTNDNVRSQESFSQMMEKLFPIGRTFCSHIQLFQVASMFAGYWAFEVTRSGCAIQCHFSKPTYQTKCSTKKK